jgi:hypothetical protein
VGHSYGGLLVRLFAHAHPDQTAGVALVESMGRNQDRRQLAIWRAQPARVRRRLPKPGAKPVEDGVNIIAGELLDPKIRTLGSTPLMAITRGRPDDMGATATPPRARPGRLAVDDHAGRASRTLKRQRARNRATQRTLRPTVPSTGNQPLSSPRSSRSSTRRPLTRNFRRARMSSTVAASAASNPTQAQAPPQLISNLRLAVANGPHFSISIPSGHDLGADTAPCGGCDRGMGSHAIPRRDARARTNADVLCHP